MKSNLNNNKGFTLVELSIVLVIIGLIIGGILTGQSIIRSAELSATVRQLANFNTATSAFRLKYNGIPGDLSAGIATSFGLTPRDGTTGKGDGNGLIEGGGSGLQGANGETAMFWRDLWKASLIEGNTSSYDSDSTPVTITAARPLDSFFPPAKIGKGAYFIVYSYNGTNYYEITGITSVNAGSGAYVGFPALSPSDAFYIDSKLDDGLPNSGVVVAPISGTTLVSPIGDVTTGAGGVNSGVCISTTANPNTYNNSNNNLLCRIVVRMY